MSIEKEERFHILSRDNILERAENYLSALPNLPSGKVSFERDLRSRSCIYQVEEVKFLCFAYKYLIKGFKLSGLRNYRYLHYSLLDTLRFDGGNDEFPSIKALTASADIFFLYIDDSSYLNPKMSRIPFSSFYTNVLRNKSKDLFIATCLDEPLFKKIFGSFDIFNWKSFMKSSYNYNNSSSFSAKAVAKKPAFKRPKESIEDEEKEVRYTSPYSS